MDKKDNIKDLSTTITVGIFFSYIIGYLVVTGFLSNFKVFNDDLLNLNFLKAGFVFLIIIVPILLIIYSNLYSQIDEQKISFQYFLVLFKKLIKTIAFSLLYIIVLSLFFIDFNKSNYNLLVYLYGITVATCVFSFIFLFFLGVKKFSWGNLISHLIWVCLVSYFFGTHVYKDLPKSFKGGFPNKTLILCKEESKDYLNRIGFNFNDSTFTDSVLIYYSSNDKLLISKNKNEFYFLSKNLFNGFKNINKK